MKQIIILILLSLMLCLKTTISSGTEKLLPSEVAAKFWEAKKTGDIATIRQYIADKSLTEDDLENPSLPISEFKIGRTIIESNQAKVKTDVILMGEKDSPMTISAETLLVNEEDQWKVLYEETVETIAQAGEVTGILHSLQELNNALSRKLGKSADILQQSLPMVEDRLKEIKEKLKTQIPGIQDRLKGITKELDDLFNVLRQALPPENENEKAKSI